MKRDKLNIALVGCGRISKSHLKAINKLKNVTNKNLTFPAFVFFFNSIIIFFWVIRIF